MTTLAQDTFIRANQSGFGTASDGSTWSHPLGTATLSISGNEGLAQSGGVDDYMLIGSGTSAPVNVLCRCRTDSNGDNVGVIGRYASGPTLYRTLKNSQTFYLQKIVSGSITTLASTAYSYGATDYDWIRLVCQGTTISATIWRDGTSEPGTPTLSVTDSSISAAGQYGLTGLNGGGTNYYDQLTVTDNQNAISLVTGTQAKFYVRSNLQTQSRAKFLVRLALKSQAQAKFLVSLKLVSQARSQFFVRSNLQTQARAKFLIRLKLATNARAKFVSRLALRTIARSRFLVNQIINPLKQFKVAFVSQSKDKVAFVSQSTYSITFSEAIAMITPNSTLQSSATVTDASGNPQATLTGTVTVSFPDGTSSVPLTPANAGSGVYTLTYTTKGTGLMSELWSFVDGSGNVLTDKNTLVCTYSH